MIQSIRVYSMFEMLYIMELCCTRQNSYIANGWDLIVQRIMIRKVIHYNV
jgi:hypothetical protein